MRRSPARNTHTPEEAVAKSCPDRFALPQPNCLGPGCMYWLWGWSEEDGFEVHREESLDWGEMADEPEALEAYLATVLGADQAHELAGLWADAPADDYDAQDAASEAIDGALAAAFHVKGGAGDGLTRLEQFVESRRPEGEGWGADGGQTAGGKMFVEYRRPAQRRGFCGKLAAVHGA